MATDYWIKLYIEILDDPKMATLPDRLWRRAVELFLIAGRMHKDGWIPDTRQIAWMMRLPTDDVEMDLQQIAATGIIEKAINGWVVINFTKRQAPVPPAQRMKEMRERRHKDQYYGDVTPRLRNVTQSQSQNQNQIQITESDVEVDPPPAAPLLAAFINATQIPEFGPGAFEYVKKMEAAGVEPQDIHTAVLEMDTKGLSIVGIKSIVNPAIIAAGKRRRGNGQNPSKPSLESEFDRLDIQTNNSDEIDCPAWENLIQRARQNGPPELASRIEARYQLYLEDPEPS